MGTGTNDERRLCVRECELKEKKKFFTAYSFSSTAKQQQQAETFISKELLVFLKP